MLSFVLQIVAIYLIVVATHAHTSNGLLGLPIVSKGTKLILKSLLQSENGL